MYERFEALMKEREWTFSDVGRMTGMRPSVFTDWRAGRYEPKHDKLVRLAKLFNVPVSYFESEEEITVFSISDFEYEIVKAYRQKGEELKEAICNMLGLGAEFKREKKEITNLA